MSSCSTVTCSNAPGIQLVNSNYVWTAVINGQVDDTVYPVSLPFNITLYGTTTSSVSVTTNGISFISYCLFDSIGIQVICFGSCSSAYTETTLPTGSFSGVTVLPYWDDLFIYTARSQGIYFGTETNATNRSLIFEFFMRHFNQPTQYYHLQVVFYEVIPNIVQYKYFEATDTGVSCTIGGQASTSGPFIQYSFHVANSVYSHLLLTFNTTQGTFTNSTF